MVTPPRYHYRLEDGTFSLTSFFVDDVTLELCEPALEPDPLPHLYLPWVATRPIFCPAKTGSE